MELKIEVFMADHGELDLLLHSVGVESIMYIYLWVVFQLSYQVPELLSGA